MIFNYTVTKCNIYIRMTQLSTSTYFHCGPMYHRLTCRQWFYKTCLCFHIEIKSRIQCSPLVWNHLAIWLFEYKCHIMTNMIRFGGAVPMRGPLATRGDPKTGGMAGWLLQEGCIVGLEEIPAGGK